MWFYAALGMACISGIYTITSKHTLKTINPIIFYWIVLTVSTPIIWIFTWKDGIPAITYTFAIGIFGSVIFYTISKIIFFKTIKDATLSHIYPLVSIGPIFTLIFSRLILSERPSGLELLGSFITMIGVYVLNISSIREGFLEPIKILYRNKLALLMIISVMVGSIVSVFDKLAINNTTPQNANFTLLIGNLVIIIALIPWIFVKRKTAFVEIIQNKWPVLFLGILLAVSNILAFAALSVGNPGLVSSVSRTQIFFVFFFSMIFFKDYPKKETILGTIVMVLGLVVLKFAS